MHISISLFSNFIFLFFIIAGSNVRAEDRMVVDEFSVIVSDTIERFGFEGEPISYTPSKRAKNNLSDELSDEASSSRHVVYAAQGEREAVQLRLSSSAAGRTLNSVSLSSFTRDTGAVLPVPDLYIVENLRKYDKLGVSAIAYPDVLTPISNITETVEYAGGVRLLVDFRIPKSTEPGLYSGSVSMSFLDGRSLRIPIDVNVWNYEIPNISSVTTQLFELDWRSIAYWYQLDPGSAELSRILSNSIDLLEDHRFSMSKIPPFRNPARSMQSLTADELQESGMKFLPGKKLEVHGASFESLSDEFSLEIELNIAEKSTGLIMEHKWHNRHSGYSLNFVDGRFSFEAAVFSKPNFLFLPLDDSYTKSTVSTHIDPSREKNTIRVDVRKERWDIFLNDELTEVLDNPGEIIPAYGAWVKLGSMKAAFTLFDLKWVLNDSGNVGVVHAGLADHKAAIHRSSTSEGTWSQRAMSSNGYLNDIREGRTFDGQSFERKLELLGLSANEQSFHLSLPLDEGHHGSSADKNLVFAHDVRTYDEHINVFHTFGSMRGKGRNKKYRTSVLEKFRNSVDIFSIRQSVYFEQLEFFNSLGSGKEVSMYIHDVNIVENRNTLLWGRNYFWALFHLDIFKTTLWNTTLWFQPAKTNRAARRLLKVEDGYAVTSRNPSGIGSGMIFYPGKEGLIPSLRSIAWRDGIEDVESLKMIQVLTSDNAEYPKHVKSAAQGLLERSNSQIMKNKDFKKLPRNWVKKLRTVRFEIGELLHSGAR